MTELIKNEPTTIYIKPSKGLAALNLRDLWIYRELIYFMIWRDVKVRYKQTMLGARGEALYTKRSGRGYCRPSGVWQFFQKGM